MSPSRERRATLKDVADHAAVSKTTVSFVLSGRRDMRISPATEERVLQAARVLGYRGTRSPYTTPVPGSPVIGLVSDTIGTEAFAGEMIRGCIAAAAEHGHTVLMAESLGDPGLESAALDSLLGRGVNRFLVGATGTRKVSVPRALVGSSTVLMNCVDRSSATTAVVPDEYAAGRTAAQTLLDAGHTDRIWLVGEVPRATFPGQRRLAGIRAALRSAGLELAGHVQCHWWPDIARDAVSAILGADDQASPTAVIAINDRAAMGVYQAAAALGMAVPDDVSVISFDNSDISRWLSPGLTSITLPYFDLGRRAVELLLDENRPGGTHTVGMSLQSRDSVAPPRQAPARPDTTRHPGTSLSRGVR
ncbi:MAG: LacI family DNA-binding transcriptional regulator [Umezawaea sp.]